MPAFVDVSCLCRLREAALEMMARSEWIVTSRESNLTDQSDWRFWNYPINKLFGDLLNEPPNSRNNID